MPSRLPEEWPNFYCSAIFSLCHFALAIQLHTEEITALCKVFAQEDQSTSKWVSVPCYNSFSYAVHILPSGAAVLVESNSGLVKFFWVGRLTATNLASIGYFRKLPKGWEWRAFPSCWFIRKTEERAGLTFAFHECLCGCDPCKGIILLVTDAKTWCFALPQQLWHMNVIAEGNFTVPPSRHIYGCIDP